MMTAFQRITSLFLLAALLSGCETAFHNLTPDRISQNPSGIYTFSFVAEVPYSSIVEGSEKAYIVINGNTFPMEKTSPANLTFSFDYKMPPGLKEARYYYILEYDYDHNGTVKSAKKYSTQEEGVVYQSHLINRYTIQLVADRGPVGASIALVGSGFAPQDVVIINGVEAATTVYSQNSLEFIVPALTAGQTYDLALRTSGGDLNVGPFKIDQANLMVQPDNISIPSGQTDWLIVEIDSPAPAGGVYVEAKTDVPTSLIMPEIFIEEGAQSTNVNVTGGEPGNGILMLQAQGFGTIEIPVSIY